MRPQIITHEFKTLQEFIDHIKTATSLSNGFNAIDAYSTLLTCIDDLYITIKVYSNYEKILLLLNHLSEKSSDFFSKDWQEKHDHVSNTSRLKTIITQFDQNYSDNEKIKFQKFCLQFISSEISGNTSLFELFTLRNEIKNDTFKTMFIEALFQYVIASGDLTAFIKLDPEIPALFCQYIENLPDEKKQKKLSLMPVFCDVISKNIKFFEQHLHLIGKEAVMLLLHMPLSEETATAKAILLENRDTLDLFLAKIHSLNQFCCLLYAMQDILTNEHRDIIFSRIRDETLYKFLMHDEDIETPDEFSMRKNFSLLQRCRLLHILYTKLYDTEMRDDYRERIVEILNRSQLEDLYEIKISLSDITIPYQKMAFLTALRIKIKDVFIEKTRIACAVETAYNALITDETIEALTASKTLSDQEKREFLTAALLQKSSGLETELMMTLEGIREKLGITKREARSRTLLKSNELLEKGIREKPGITKQETRSRTLLSFFITPKRKALGETSVKESELSL